MDNVQNLLINNICSVINLPAGLLNSGRKAGMAQIAELIALLAYLHRQTQQHGRQECIRCISRGPQAHRLQVAETAALCIRSTRISPDPTASRPDGVENIDEAAEEVARALAEFTAADLVGGALPLAALDVLTHYDLSSASSMAVFGSQEVQPTSQAATVTDLAPAKAEEQVDVELFFRQIMNS